MADPFNLARFKTAQEEGGTYARALTELSTGRKVSHWMWFVFPQLAGLGRSSTARYYAIGSLPEAAAYLRDLVLGPRLVACSDLVATRTDRSAVDIFGSVDAVKLRSCMTLFGRISESSPVFAAVLDRHFDGKGDPRTEELLDAPGPPA